MAVATDVRTVAPPATRRKGGWQRKFRRSSWKSLIYALLIGGTVISIFPFAWMVSASFQPLSEMFSYPPHWIPQHATIQHYVNFFHGTRYQSVQDIGRWILNSAYVAIAVTLLQMFFNSLMAYQFAKRKFPGRDLIFFLFIATMMIPGQVTLIPTYLVLKHVPLFGGNNIAGFGGHGWLDSYWGLIVPVAVSPFGIFLMRQYFKTIPDELLDAARIDGASEFRIFWRIAMPLARPALAAMAIFTFTYFWDDFFWPLIIISSPSLYTLPLGLASFASANKTIWTLIMAGSVIATVPVIIVFIIFQKNFVRGIALTGLKG